LLWHRQRARAARARLASIKAAALNCLISVYGAPGIALRDIFGWARQAPLQARWHGALHHRAGSLSRCHRCPAENCVLLDAATTATALVRKSGMKAKAKL